MAIRDPEKKRAVGRAWYAANPDRRRRHEREYRQRQRLAVLSHYSNGLLACAHCPFNIVDALELDHIANDGAAHRREVSTRKLYGGLIATGFPSGYQVLCRNCNWLKERIACRKS